MNFGYPGRMSDSATPPPEPAKTGSSYHNNLRRVFHFVSITIFSLIFGLSQWSIERSMAAISIAVILFICADLARLHINWLNELIQTKLKFLLRKHEFHSLSGTSWFLLSALISLEGKYGKKRFSNWSLWSALKREQVVLTGPQSRLQTSIEPCGSRSSTTLGWEKSQTNPSLEQVRKVTDGNISSEGRKTPIQLPQ